MVRIHYHGWWSEILWVKNLERVQQGWLVPAPCLGQQLGELKGWGALTCLEAFSLTRLCLGSKTHTRPGVPTMWPLHVACFLKAWGLQSSPAHMGTKDSKHRPPSTQLRLAVPLWPCPECHMVSPLLSTVGRGNHQPAQIPGLEMQTLPLGWRNSMGF